jgi:lysine-specific demethylase/histidyl-hydroxylase NO66
MAKLDFSYLIAPSTATGFFDQYWQKSALLIKRGEADRYRGLIDAADADAILTMAGQLPAEAVEVISRIQTNETSGEPAGALADLFGKGATIRVKAIERFSEPLGELGRNLEELMGCPVRANLYCTPGNSRGFNLHFDTHEVFVLQLLGKKQWQIFEPTTPLPLEYVPALPFEDDRDALRRFRGGKAASERDIQGDIDETELGPLAFEALLEPGDCLYLPRGFVHQANAHDEPSVHLTIGIHVLTWLDLLSVALGQAAYRNEEFRQALPVGLFTERNNAAEFEKEFSERMRVFVRDAVFATAVSEIVESLAHSRSAGSPGDNHDAIGEVDKETKLEGNGLLRFYLAADGMMAGLACGQKECWLPVGFAPALRFVTEQKVFRPLEIPGTITDNGKLAFVRHLLKDGFLRIAQ